MRRPYRLPGASREKRQAGRALLSMGAAAALLLLLLLAATTVRRLRSPIEDHRPAPPSPPPVASLESGSALAKMVFPTPRAFPFENPPEAVFQPTASGRLESAFYGSVRTANRGGQIFPSFHEGIDLVPVRRDGRGRALDPIFAVSDGRVAYVNAHPGNSNYGIYIVLLHPDPVGEVYTLYAHLSEVGDGIQAGRPVRAGDVLGTMGNTPSHIVPVQRAHLHFEIGMVLNRRFESWTRAQKMTNPHGRYHGWNLLGVDPLLVLEDQHRRGRFFCMGSHLAGLPEAFKLLIPAQRLPDYFQRYPSLWEGGDFRGPALVVSVSEGGIPLRGRPASAQESARIDNREPVVLSADPEVLGANGARLVARRGESWTLGSQGGRWLEWLRYH